MSFFYKALYKLNFKECKEYNLGLWQCPSFLFIVMGIVNISSMLGVYIVVSRFNTPELVIASVTAVSAIIFIIGTSIIKGVEQIGKVNRVKSEFISIASHQLKAPLSGMRWSTDILLNSKLGLLNTKQEEYIKDIQENTARMLRLVNDLLDVSKIESGKMDVNLQEVDLKGILKSVIKELNFFAQANNAELVINIDEHVQKTKTDPIRIKMVIQNLIDNAVKYIGVKKGTVRIDLKNKEKYVYCSIADNGIGIPQKEQGKIFDKFFRGDGVARRQTIGSGLGLYIAKAVIESSGGKIGFISKEGKGSTFWFTLPSV